MKKQNRTRERQFKIYLSDEEFLKLENICKLLDITKSDFFRDIINQYGY